MLGVLSRPHLTGAAACWDGKRPWDWLLHALAVGDLRGLTYAMDMFRRVEELHVVVVEGSGCVGAFYGDCGASRRGADAKIHAGDEQGISAQNAHCLRRVLRRAW